MREKGECLDGVNKGPMRGMSLTFVDDKEKTDDAKDVDVHAG